MTAVAKQAAANAPYTAPGERFADDDMSEPFQVFEAIGLLRCGAATESQRNERRDNATTAHPP